MHVANTNEGVKGLLHTAMAAFVLSHNNLKSSLKSDAETFLVLKKTKKKTESSEPINQILEMCQVVMFFTEHEKRQLVSVFLQGILCSSSGGRK